MNRFLAAFGGISALAYTHSLCHADLPVVTRVRIGNGSAGRGALFVTVNAVEKKVADNVEKADKILGGKMVAFDQFVKTGDGDQKINAFKIYEVATSKIRTLVYPFNEGETSLQELKTSSGAAILNLVQGSASGSPYLYLIDPARGVVFHPEQPARIIKRQADIITVGFFHVGEAPPDKPFKAQTLSLTALVKNQRKR